MPRYPSRKTARDALYDAIVAGITANPAQYPAGPGQPFSLTTFNGLITKKNTAVNTRQQEEGQFRIAVVAENDAYEDCDAEARRLLDLAIATHGVSSPLLTLIGWGPPSPAVSNVPGQPRNLEAVAQGPGTCFLDWKAPAPAGPAGGPIGGGEPPGEVGFYRVERRKRTLAGQQTEDWGAWQATTTDSEITLLSLERGVEYDFRVLAVNAAGDSLPSNLVTVVL
jgi:hypothetical protein